MGERRYECVLKFPSNWEKRKFTFKFILNSEKWVTSSLYPVEKDLVGNENNVIIATSQAISSTSASVFETIQVPKGYLNALHVRMAQEGFSEVYISMESDDTMVVIRQNPVKMESYSLIARSCYLSNAVVTGLKPFKLPGVVNSVELIAQLSLKDWEYTANADEVNGYRGVVEIFSTLGKFATISHV